MNNVSWIFDSGTLHIISVVQQFYLKYAGTLITTGQAIGGILCLIPIAKEAYSAMTLKKQLDFSVLFRPIAIAIILMNWYAFTNALRSPGDSLEQWGQQVFFLRMEKVNDIYKERLNLVTQEYNSLRENYAESKALEDSQSNGEKTWYDKIFDKAEDVWKLVTSTWKTLYDSYITFIWSIIDSIIGLIGVLYIQFCFYCVLFMKEIALGLLVITGPITFGISVLDIWKDSWANWVSRYLSFSLYGFIAYFIMLGGVVLIAYSLQLDIKAISNSINGGSGVLEWYGGRHLYNIFSCLGFFITATMVKMTPEFASYVFPTGSSQAIAHFINGASGLPAKVATTATGVTGKAIK